MPRNYEDIYATFLMPQEFPRPVPVVPDSLSRRLRDALEPVATIGSWSRAAAEGAAVIGLDFLNAYVWGRAASLGSDVDPSVVVSCFGVFSPDMVVPSPDVWTEDRIA